MNIMLDIKNASALKKPNNGHIILYDGEKWYVTTRDALFKEYQDKVDAKLAEIERKEAKMLEETQEFQKKVSSDVLQLTELIENIYK